MPAKKGPGSVKSGINFMQGYQILIDPRCEGMREEARLYSWMTDELTGKMLNTPVDAHNHGFDAARYAIEDLLIDAPSRSATTRTGGAETQDVVTHGKLTSSRSRKRLPKKCFALKGKRAYPIHDRSHAANALSRVAQHGTASQKKTVRAQFAAVIRRCPACK